MVDMIGEKIKILRNEQKMTQQDLADRVGVSKNAISLYETSKKLPSLSTLCKLAITLNVSTDYLLGMSNSRDADFSDLDEEQLEIIHRTIHQFERYNRMKNKI